MRTIELARCFADHVDAHGLDDTEVDLHVDDRRQRCKAHIVPQDLERFLRWADTLTDADYRIKAGPQKTFHVFATGTMAAGVLEVLNIVLVGNELVGTGRHAAFAGRMAGNEVVRVTVDELRELAGTAVTS